MPRLLVVIDAENRAAALDYRYPATSIVHAFCGAGFDIGAFRGRTVSPIEWHVSRSRGRDAADIKIAFWLGRNLDRIAAEMGRARILIVSADHALDRVQHVIAEDGGSAMQIEVQVAPLF
jgi:hypothetical protein